MAVGIGTVAIVLSAGAAIAIMTSVGVGIYQSRKYDKLSERALEEAEVSREMQQKMHDDAMKLSHTQILISVIGLILTLCFLGFAIYQYRQAKTGGI